MKKIIIIGGGIGGLCTAIALQQNGFEVSVYEKVEKLGTVGAGLTLWTNAVKVLRAIGVADQVIGAGSKVSRSYIRTSNGDILHDARMGEFEEKYGEPVVAIHRSALHEILINALKPNTLKLGVGFMKFEQDESKVTVHFDNSETDSADLLIGADGIHSAVRKQMFPNIQLRYSGYTAWRGVVETQDEVALGVTSESWGVGARFGIVRVDAKRVYWFATNNQPAGEKSTGEQRKAKLLSLFKDWHDPIRYLLDLTPAELDSAKRHLRHPTLRFMDSGTRDSAWRLCPRYDSQYGTRRLHGNRVGLRVESLAERGSRHRVRVEAL